MKRHVLGRLIISANYYHEDARVTKENMAGFYRLRLTDAPAPGRLIEFDRAVWNSGTCDLRFICCLAPGILDLGALIRDNEISRGIPPRKMTGALF